MTQRHRPDALRLPGGSVLCLRSLHPSSVLRVARPELFYRLTHQLLTHELLTHQMYQRVDPRSLRKVLWLLGQRALPRVPAEALELRGPSCLRKKHTVHNQMNVFKHPHASRLVYCYFV